MKLYELRMLTGGECLVCKTIMVCTCGVSVFLGERRVQLEDVINWLSVYTNARDSWSSVFPCPDPVLHRHCSDSDPQGLKLGPHWLQIF